MADDDLRKKWNERYAQSDIVVPRPCWVLTRYEHLLPEGGRALDLACGLGGNAIYLAEKGFFVSAWDISDVAIRTLQNLALSRNLMIDAEVCDVEVVFPEARSQDLIVVSHFLHRPLFPALVAALKPGGMIYYQTWSRDKTPDAGGPGNPDFLLGRNELLRAFASLDVLAFHDEGVQGREPRGQSVIVARKPA